MSAKSYRNLKIAGFLG